MSLRRCSMAALILLALAPGPASAILHQGPLAGKASPAVSKPAVSKPAVPKAATPNTGIYVGVAAAAAAPKAVATPAAQRPKPYEDPKFNKPSPPAKAQNASVAMLHEEVDGNAKTKGLHLLDEHARHELQLWKAKRAAALAASQSKVRTFSISQLRAKAKAERLAKWEAYERRKEAERKTFRAHEKLAKVKKANVERMAQEKQMEKARWQKVATARAAKQKEKEEQQREAALPAGSVRINVIDGKNYGVRMTVKKEGVRTHVLMATALQRMGLQGKKMAFIHNGVEMKEDDPIEKYQLDDYDTIDLRRKWW